MTTAMYNNKGGVGKTTLAVHVAFAAVKYGYPLTFLDADRQANSMAWLAQHQWDGEVSFETGPVRVTADLADAEWADPLLIDAPPDFYFIENLPFDVDLWVIPVAGRFSVEGAMRVVERLRGQRDVRTLLVVNMTNPHSKIGRYEIDEAMKLGLEVFPLVIPRSEMVRKAEMLGRPVWDVPYGANSPTTHALMHFAHWLLEGADEQYVYSEYSVPRNQLLRRYEI